MNDADAHEMQRLENAIDDAYNQVGLPGVINALHDAFDELHQRTLRNDSMREAQVFRALAKFMRQIEIGG